MTHALATGLDIFDAKFETLEKYVGEVDARHTHIVMSEVGPLKDQVQELRNQLGPLNMSVRWLLDKALQTSKRGGTTALQTSDSNDANTPQQDRQSRSESSDAEPGLMTSPAVRRMSNREDTPRL